MNDDITNIDLFSNHEDTIENNNNENNNNEKKRVIINGTNNRYQIKKLITEKKEPKKRILSEKWKLSKEYYTYDKQLQIMKDILSESGEIIDNNSVHKLMNQQINHKITGYKRQDIIRNILDEDKFIQFKEIVSRLVECELKCYYCKENILILYDMSREMNQWTVDRIDNNKGHNIDNFHIACLKCNLKRRRQSDDKFLYTKQLHIIKI